MDSQSEFTFLQILSKNLQALEKAKSDVAKSERHAAWQKVTDLFIAKTGRTESVQQLIQKWNNVKFRIRNKLARGMPVNTKRLTSGMSDPAANDLLAIEILYKLNLLDGTIADDNGGSNKQNLWDDKMADTKPGLCSELVEICLEEGSNEVNNMDDSIDIEEFDENSGGFSNAVPSNFQETPALKTPLKRSPSGLTLFEEELMKLAKEKHAKEMKKLDLEIEVLQLKRKKLMMKDG